MINNDKGQVSIEFILIVGAVLTMVIVGIPIILKNAEMNRGLAAARDGATYAVGMVGMGFSEDGSGEAGVMKITEIELVSMAPFDEKERFVLIIRVDAPDELATINNRNIIRQQSRSFINNAFTGEYDNTFLWVYGDYYGFLPTVVFE
jgi:hypothetical protein